MADAVEDHPVCPETGAPMHRDTRPMMIAYKGETATFDMPGWYCDESAESIHDGSDMKVSDRALTELKAKVEGRLAPRRLSKAMNSDADMKNTDIGIVAPTPNPNRTAFRVIVEAFAQLTPVTAGIARIFQFTHPSVAEEAIVQWRKDTSQALNTIEAQLNKRIAFGESALEVARYLTTAADNGYNDDITFERIEVALPNLTRPILQQACFDLEQVRLVRVDTVMGRPVVSVRLSTDFFETFDPYFVETNPKMDALEIAQELLDLDSSISARDLEVLSDWPRRRFNPAFSIITKKLPSACLRKPINPDYPATCVDLDPKGRAVLTRFITENT